MALHRWEEGGPGDDVIVVVNLGTPSTATTASGSLPRVWCSNSDPHLDNPTFVDAASADLGAVPEPLDGCPASASVALGVYAALVYRRE